jgi:hypothetical protein
VQNSRGSGCLLSIFFPCEEMGKYFLLIINQY